MFYSQLLLSKKGALGVVWMAAHCHKRLKKDQVQRTSISSSVDKILDDEVHVVAHRILAFLLLGIVRIYSKKVEYLFHDCHEVLGKLCNLKTGKKSKHAVVGASRTHYHSISFPKRFELDAFDLELLDDQDLVCVSVGSHEEIMLADRSHKEGSTSGLLYKENIAFDETHSTTTTPVKDVFSPYRMNHNFFTRTSFSLEDRLDPMVLDEAEEEQMRYKPSNKNLRSHSQGPANNIESDSVVSHSVPSLEKLRGTRFSSEDNVMLDEAEKEQQNDKSSNENIIKPNLEIQDMELDSSTKPPPQESDLATNLGTLHNSGGFSLEYSPVLKILNEAEKEQGNDKPCAKEHVEQTGTHLNDQENERCGSIDEAEAVGPKKMKSLEVVTSESIKCQRPEEKFAFSTPDLKLPAGVGTPEAVTVRTPAPKEGAKILKKRKTLFDLSTLVPNKLLKSWIEEDPSDLKRPKREVPQSLLHAWRAQKLAYIPQSFFDPLISGISMDLASLQHKIPASKISVEKTASRDNDVKSPVASTVHEQIPAVGSVTAHDQIPVIGSAGAGGVQEEILAVGSPVTPRSREQTPFAPGTPVAHVNLFRSHEAGEVADSDILEPTSSLESMNKCRCTSGGVELDAAFEEETNSFAGDNKEKDAYSARTRLMGSYLIKKFLDKKRRNEEKVLNLSRLLAGKTRKESARLFYEILILKTRDCIDVQQKIAFGDICLQETSKLNQAFEN